MTDSVLAISDEFTEVELDVLDYWLRAFNAGIDAKLVIGVLRAGLRLEHFKSAFLHVAPTTEQLATIDFLRAEFAARKDDVDAAFLSLDLARQDRSPLQGSGEGSGASGSGEGGYGR